MRIRPRALPLIPSSSSSSAAPATKDEIVHEELQLEGLHSSGKVFPASVTLSQFKVNSKLYYGVYIRDISYMRNIEAQMEKEREMLSTQQRKLQDRMFYTLPLTFLTTNHACSVVECVPQVHRGAAFDQRRRIPAPSHR